MSGETGERTEQATPEKLRKARQEGQVAKSHDFVGACGFALGLFTLATLSAYVVVPLRSFMEKTMTESLADPSVKLVSTLYFEALTLIVKVSLPVGLTVLLAGVFSNVIQTGFFAAFKVLSPKLKPLNPVSGLRGLFKVRKLAELAKTVLKMAAASYLAYEVIDAALYDVTLMATVPLPGAIRVSGRLLFEFLSKTAVLFICIGVVDLAWSRWQFQREQMMSRHDVKQEYKQMEGDPQLKGHRKQLARELLFAGAEATKNADAVVVNPTHLAVAIKYEGDHNAPRVVAKGRRSRAQKIKALAKTHGVPVFRNVPLARALNRLDVDEEIPEALYVAVAEVLSLVYRLKEERPSQAESSPEARPSGDRQC